MRSQAPLPCGILTAAPPQHTAQVVVVLIGINNSDPAEAAARLDMLLAWLAAAQPQSRVVVLAPLPTVLARANTLRAATEHMVAQRHPQVGGVG